MLETPFAQFSEYDKTYILSLFKEYYGYVRKLVYTITQEQESVSNLVDDIFIRLAQNATVMRTFDRWKTISYIVYMSRCISISYLMHQTKEDNPTNDSVQPAVVQELFEVEDDKKDQLIQQGDIDDISNAISILPQNQKDLAYFKYVLEMSDDEIADIYGIDKRSACHYLTCVRLNAKKLTEKKAGNDGSIFRLAMNSLAETEGKLFLEENDLLKSDPENLRSLESTNRFSKLLDTHLKDAKKSQRWGLFKKLGPKS